jgi:hypothetical protein
MSGEQWTVNSDSKLGGFLAHAAELYKTHKHVTFKWTTGQQRTDTQNASLHLWCEMVAKSLNEAGLEMVVSLPTGKEVDYPLVQAHGEGKHLATSARGYYRQAIHSRCQAS